MIAVVVSKPNVASRVIPGRQIETRGARNRIGIASNARPLTMEPDTRVRCEGTPRGAKKSNINKD